MTSQLVLSEDHGGVALRLVPFFEDEEPFSFEREHKGSHVARLGSDDLIYIAAFASRSGFTVRGFWLIARNGSRLSPRDEEVVSGQLKLAIETTGPDVASALLSRDFPGYNVVAVDLLAPSMDELSVRRFGVLEADNEAQAVGLLRRAWERLRFS